MQESDKHKDNIFQTPEAYFDKLPWRLQERIRQEEAKEEKSFSLPQWTYAAAASVLLLLVGGILFYQQDTQPAEMASAELKVEQLLASVSDDEIMDYLQTNAEPTILELSLTDEEQEELLLNELDNYNISLEDYAYDVEYIEDYF